MKKMNQNKYSWLLLIFAFIAIGNKAAAQDEPAKPVSIVSLRYFNINNSTQYLLLKSISKLGRVLTPQENKTIRNIPRQQCSKQFDWQSNN